jgi:hypothetical protein
MLVENPLGTRLNVNRVFLGVASPSPGSDLRDDPWIRSLRASTPAAADVRLDRRLQALAMAVSDLRSCLSFPVQIEY